MNTDAQTQTIPHINWVDKCRECKKTRDECERALAERAPVLNGKQRRQVWFAVLGVTVMLGLLGTITWITALHTRRDAERVHACVDVGGSWINGSCIVPQVVRGPGG